MRKFHVRVFLDNPRNAWPCDDYERFICKFEDGVELEVTTPRLEFSSLLWELHRHFKRLGLHSTHYIGNGAVPWSVMAGVLSSEIEDLYKVYTPDEFNKEEIWKLVYRNVNDVYNKSTSNYKAYMRSVSAFDYAEVYHSKVFKEVREKLRPTNKSINEAGKKIMEFMKTDESLKHNPVVSDLRNGITKGEQMLQVMVARGFNTDIDDHIYPKPIMSNYFNGVHDVGENFIDSTLASKAYLYQKRPLETTQYGNRKLQFTSGRIDLMVQGDCGSHTYARIMVTEDRVGGLLGLYFRDGNKLTEFTRGISKAYVGKVLEFRMAIYCAYRDKRCVCETCYGTLSRNIPWGTNIGHLASVNTQSEVSQKVLKVKHVETLTTDVVMNLSGAEREFLAVNEDTPNKLYLNPDIKKRGIRMLINSNEKDKIINGSRLAVVDVREINPERSVAHLSQFKEMLFQVPLADGKVERVRVNVSKGSMPGHLSAKFLRWLLAGDLREDSEGYYNVDLSDWDFEQSFLDLPKKHISMIDFSAEVETFIRSTADSSAKRLGKLRQLKDYTDTTAAIVDLYDLITSRVDVHMTHVAIVCMSMLVPRDSKFEVRMPKLGEPSRFAKYSMIMNYGSWGVISAYQGGTDLLVKPDQYACVTREPHLLDPILIYNK